MLDPEGTTGHGHLHPSCLPPFSLTAELFAASASQQPPHTPAAPLPQAHHFVSGPGTFALESVELPPVVDGDEQLPERQQDDADQHHAANHRQHDRHGAGG